MAQKAGTLKVRKEVQKQTRNQSGLTVKLNLLEKNPKRWQFAWQRSRPPVSYAFCRDLGGASRGGGIPRKRRSGWGPGQLCVGAST